MIRDTERSSHTNFETRGCIDLGSTNFRLLVADGAFPAAGSASRGALELRGFREAKRFVAWGDDLARAGSISPESETLASRALGELLAQARAWGCAGPAVVATNTLREAANAREVSAALAGAHGVSISVLSQREEAALGYFGASFFLGGDDPILLADAGGTSTEISWGRGISMEGYRGLPLGTHRIERMLEAGARERVVSRLVSGAVREAGRGGAGSGVYPLPAPARDSTMIVTGGTAVSLAMFHRYLSGVTPPFEEMMRLSRGDVALARRRLVGVRGAGRERRLPLEPGRIRLFPAGLLLIDALLEAAGVEVFRVTARDLRWGVLLTGGTTA